MSVCADCCLYCIQYTACMDLFAVVSVCLSVFPACLHCTVYHRSRVREAWNHLSPGWMRITLTLLGVWNQADGYHYLRELGARTLKQAHTHSDVYQGVMKLYAPISLLKQHICMYNTHTGACNRTCIGRLRWSGAPKQLSVCGPTSNTRYALP